jgi:sterol carrier protein 2
VKYGQVECALALGFERMEPGSLGTNFPDRIPPTIILTMKSQELESAGLGENHGPSAPRMFSNGAQEYFVKYGGGIEHLAKIGRVALCSIHGFDPDFFFGVASKNHRHSVNNPYSQFRNGWSVEQVLNAPKITNQLTKFMCSPTSVISFACD